MALINCPECGREVSDKAVSCPKCGYPICDFIESFDFEKDKGVDEILTAEFKEGYELEYCNGFIKFTDLGKDIFSGKVSEIVIYRVDRTMFGNGVIYLHVPNTRIPGKLRCISQMDYDNCFKILQDAILRKEHKGSFEGVYRGLQEVYCPRCKSSNCEHYIEEKAIPEKTKITYSANINPLKPLTLVNKNEKVVKKEHIQKIKKFRCKDCREIFH